MKACLRIITVEPWSFSSSQTFNWKHLDEIQAPPRGFWLNNRPLNFQTNLYTQSRLKNGYTLCPNPFFFFIPSPQDGLSRCEQLAYLQIWVHHELDSGKGKRKEKKRDVKYMDIARKKQNYHYSQNMSFFTWKTQMYLETNDQNSIGSLKCWLDTVRCKYKGKLHPYTNISFITELNRYPGVKLRMAT